MATLLEQIKASAAYLRCLDDDVSMQQEAAQSRLKALLAAVANSSMTVADATQCVQACPTLAFTVEQHRMLKEAINARISTGMPSISAGVVRSSLQDYCHLPAYFTEELWTEIMQGGASQIRVSQVIVMRGKLLGLRYPSESTCQTLAALFLAAAFGLPRAMELDAAAKHDALKAIKAEVKRHCSEIAGPASLPAQPAQLMQSDPELYHRVFGAESPVASKFAFSEFAALTESVPMRRTRRGVSEPSQPKPQMQMQMQAPQGQFDIAAFFGQALQMMQRSQEAQAPINLQFTGQQQQPQQQQNPALRRLESQVALTNALQSESAPQSSPASSSLPVRLAPQSPASTSFSTGAESRSQLPQEPVETPERGAKRAAPEDVDAATRAILTSMDKRNSAKVKAEPKSRPKAKAKGKAKAQAKAQAKSQAKPKAAAQAAAKVKAPHFGHESTRNQFLCRTGLSGPGQSTAFKYENASSKAKAEKLAEAWVSKQKKERGL